MGSMLGSAEHIACDPMGCGASKGLTGQELMEASVQPEGVTPVKALLPASPSGGPTGGRSSPTTPLESDTFEGENNEDTELAQLTGVNNIV
jgi:hypothetical protein